MKFVDGSHVSPHSFCQRPDAARCGAGLEVFLLKRDGLSDVLGGAYVFPAASCTLTTWSLSTASTSVLAEARSRKPPHNELDLYPLSPLL